MPNGTPSDHDLLIRIDTTVNSIKANYIDKDKLENAVNSGIVTHERKMHRNISWGFIGQILTALAFTGAAIWAIMQN